MKFFSQLSKYYTAGLIISVTISVFLLSRSINQLAKAMSNTDSPAPVIEKKEKAVTPILTEKAELVYLEGKLDTSVIIPLSNYKFSPDLPDELYHGYMVLVNDNNGGKYFIWTQQKPQIINTKMSGYFHPISHQYQINDSEEFAQLLLPVIRKDLPI